MKNDLNQQIKQATKKLKRLFSQEQSHPNNKTRERIKNEEKRIDRLSEKKKLGKLL